MSSNKSKFALINASNLRNKHSNIPHIVEQTVTTEIVTTNSNLTIQNVTDLINTNNQTLDQLNKTVGNLSSEVNKSVQQLINNNSEITKLLEQISLSSPQSKTQILTEMVELDSSADVYIINLSDDYMSKNMAAQFIIKSGKPGDKKTIIAYKLNHVMFYTTNVFDNVSEIHFHRTGQTVSLVNYELGGWTVSSFNGNKQAGANHWENPGIISYNGSQPNYLYILCTARRMPMKDNTGTLVSQPSNGKYRRDYVTVIDINPMSVTYKQIVDRIYVGSDDKESDELHHGHLTEDGRFLIAPGLSSSAINILDLRVSERHPKVYNRIQPEDVYAATGKSNLHTVLEVQHTYGNNLLISALSDRKSEADDRGARGKGGLIMLNNSFEKTSEFPHGVKPFIDSNDYDEVKYNYDIDIKEANMVMMTSEWTTYGGPFGFDAGFFNPVVNPVDFERYGHRVHIWNIMNKELVQTLDLRNTFLSSIMPSVAKDPAIDVPDSGEVPLEIRFLNKEMSRVAIVSCVTGLAPEATNADSGLKLSQGVLVAVYCPEGQDVLKPTWKAKQVAKIPDVNGVIPAVTDITLSIDEKCLYVSCWLQGRLIQYDLTKVQDVISGKIPELPILSDVWLGGLIYNNDNNPFKPSLTMPGCDANCDCGDNCNCGTTQTTDNMGGMDMGSKSVKSGCQCNCATGKSARKIKSCCGSGCGCAPKPVAKCADHALNDPSHNIHTEINGVTLTGGPQMLRVTPDCRTLFVTGSLYSQWDDQFYADGTGDKSIKNKGSWLVGIDTGFVNGVRVGPMVVDKSWFIDFSNEPDGPTRTHELHMRGATH